MGRTTRLRNTIEKIFQEKAKEGTFTSGEILAEVNKRTKHGSSMARISNILSKDKRFVKVGFLSVSNDMTSKGHFVAHGKSETTYAPRMRQCVWGLSESKEMCKGCNCPDGEFGNPPLRDEED